MGEGSCSVHHGICVLCPLDASSSPSPIFLIAQSASSHQTSLKGTMALDENHGGEVTVTSSVPQARTPRAILESLPPLKSPVTGWFSQVPQLPQESASCLMGCSPRPSVWAGSTDLEGTSQHPHPHQVYLLLLPKWMVSSPTA